MNLQKYDDSLCLTKIPAIFLSKLTFILSPCYIMGASQSSYEDENIDNVESEEKNEEWSITVTILHILMNFRSVKHCQTESMIMYRNN